MTADVMLSEPPRKGRPSTKPDAAASAAAGRRRALIESSRRYCAALDDRAYQAFRLYLPGLVPAEVARTARTGPGA